MGNKIARTTQVSASEHYLHDLPSSYDLVLKEVLGRGRFFKSIQCKHDEGLALVEVNFKRGDSIDLRGYEHRLAYIMETFRSLENPHLLISAKQCHNKGIRHGDIKCENVLVSSWNWFYLADFASFKPIYIPYDDPSDFSFSFDIGGRRLCYLAPEDDWERLFSWL